VADEAEREPADLRRRIVAIEKRLEHIEAVLLRSQPPSTADLKVQAPAIAVGSAPTTPSEVASPAGAPSEDIPTLEAVEAAEPPSLPKEPV
jgi:hypothetical protein